MRYSQTKTPRRKRETLVEEQKFDHAKNWWGTPVKNGVALILRRIASEIERGDLTYFDVKWAGKDTINCIINGETVRIQLDSRVDDDAQ